MKNWQKWIPWIITGVCGLFILITLKPARTDSPFNVEEFARIPVILNGRIQPLDSVARNSLLIIRSKQSVRLDRGEELDATQWLLEVLLKPEVADERKVFRIDHPEIKGLFDLPAEEKHFSFNQLKPYWQTLQEQAERISQIEAQVREPFDKQMAKLHQGFGIYFRLKNSLHPEGSEDFARELALFKQSLGPGLEAFRQRQAGEEYSQQDLALMAEFFQRYQTMSDLAYPLAVPPEDPRQDPLDWDNVGEELLMSVRTGKIHPVVDQFAEMSSAYHGGDPERFNKAVAAYHTWLKEHYPAAAKKGERESYFNHYEPFYKSSVLYVLAFLLGCASWVNMSGWMRRTGHWLVLLSLVVHTSGLIFRMVLEGRPPVTNLYSSAIFVGWGAVLLGVILERFFKDAVGLVVAAAVGFTTLVIAHNLSMDGDTMEMLRAVLDTNFWLATHVVVITIGYSAMFVAGFLAIVYVIRKSLDSSFSQQTVKNLARMVYGIICFGTLFSFVGTVLGGIWADQSWGRFWGWDPKENGALLIVIWCAIVLHARWGGMIREPGLMAMAIFGNIVTSFSWFGVNMLGVGLHSYGFMDEAFKWLALFVVSQLILMGLAAAPPLAGVIASRRSARHASTAGRPSPEIESERSKAGR